MDQRHIAVRAEQIVEKIQQSGPQQVRLDGDHVLTYMHPAPRGYGVRGVLVGVYATGAQPEWICDDVMSLIGGDRAA